jgi:putative salt-induced outer membrane protein
MTKEERMKSLFAISAVMAMVVLFSVKPVVAEDEKDLSGIHNNSEVGVVITSGNSDTQSLNFNQVNTYGWDENLNLAKFTGKYLDTSNNSVATARYWTAGLRYERAASKIFSLYVGQMEESDIFSGYNQRYNTDVGAKYFIYKEDAFVWSAEAGYRYTIENRLTQQVHQNYLRAYTEAVRDWTKTFSTKADVEYLPNLTVTTDYQINSEVAASAAINDVFAIKVGYVVKYRNLPPPPAIHTTDTQFTTALVSKF